MSGESVVIRADDIFAVFHRENQRWIHHIDLPRDAGAPEVVMRSLEGAADDAWPPSPVIQQLEVQLQEGAVSSVMGLGMSGPVHWSLSCRAAPHPLPGLSEIKCLLFEVACRLPGAFERVGTCYHVVPEIAATQVKQNILYTSRIGAWSVSANGATISNMNQTLRFDAFDEVDDPAPRTVQWAYAINRVSDAK